MDREMSVYITALLDSLKDKQNVLEKIYSLTREQAKILEGDAWSDERIESFEAILPRKELLLERMAELDAGFESVYHRISDALHAQKQIYKPQILEMQNLIRVSTDLGIQIQALEQRNKNRFEQLTKQKYHEIKNFKTNNKTANSYYQNMTNQPGNWQSFFVDQKK